MKDQKNIWIVLVIFFAGIIGGAFAYHSVEGWNLLDSFYFVIVTVTTIGYGDFSPVTNIGKLFTMFFAFFGVATALYLLSATSSSLFKKHFGQKVSQIKKGVQKEEEVRKEVRNAIKKVVGKKQKKR